MKPGVWIIVCPYSDMELESETAQVLQREEWLKAWPWAKMVAMRVEVKLQFGKFESWVVVWAEEEAEPGRLARRLRRRQAQPEERAKLQVQGDAESRAQHEALALAGAWRWAQALAEARERGESVPSAVADSSTVNLILSILSSLHRDGIAPSLWHHSPEGREEYSCIINFIAPITRLPFELLRQIFLIIINQASSPPMLVCRHWHAIVTSTWASLRLGTRTPMDIIARKLEGKSWLLDVVVDTDSDRGDFTPSDSAFEAIFAAIEASSRWRSLVVESFPGQADLPEDLVNRGLQRCPNTSMNVFTTFKVKSTCETSPLLNGLLHILGTTASLELTTVEINSPNVISFLAPAYPSIFQSIKDLSLDTPGIPNPVDLLPHLHQLETFTASHISFPIYQSDVNLPFIHTLRSLTLRAVSIQWMSGRTFHVLEDCTLIFPLHHLVLHTFGATLPNCKHLTFQGSPLDILNGISAHKLTHFSVTCSGSFVGRGSQQLVQLSRQVLGGSRLAPTILHISVEATNQAWINALFLMPNLEELMIDCVGPTSLGAKVFRSLIIWPTRRGRRTPLCPSLKRLRLKYRRWLRRSERFGLIPDLVYMIKSREPSNYTLQSLTIWLKSDQGGPLELIEGSRLSQRGLRRLADASGINEEVLFELVTMGFLRIALKSFMEPPKMVQENI